MVYLVEVPHNEAECLRALDEQLEKGSDILDKFYYGCHVGDHTGYAIVEADNDREVKSLIPDFLIDKSLITELRKYTPEMIRSYHVKAA